MKSFVIYNKYIATIARIGDNLVELYLFTLKELK